MRQGIGEARPILAGFDTVRLLGAGAAATVWLVAAHNGQGVRAAKCVPHLALPEADSARNNETQITREWRILAHYDHEHLLKAHDLVPYSLEGEDAGVAMIADFAPGGSVQDLVRARGPLNVGEVVTVLTPLGEVLSFLHGQGAVHGDVSPGNVLFTAEGKPVLGDLGFAGHPGQPRDHAGGTPGFYCPQDHGCTSASDVYAMAAVGWYALTGQAPAATIDRLPLRTTLPNVPHELVAALEAGLCEDSRQRPTAAAFAQAVFRSARAEAVALAVSVHPSVLPDLLTRRELGDRRGHGRRSSLLPRLLQRHRRPPISGLWGERRTRSGHAGRATRWGLALAALLVMGGMTIGIRVLLDSNEATGNDPLAAPGATHQPGQSAQPPSSTEASAPPTGDPESTRVASASELPEEIRSGLVSKDPTIALAALARARSHALMGDNRPLLEAVNAPSSPAMTADQALAERLRQAGHSFSGLDVVVTQSEQLPEPCEMAGNPCVLIQATITTAPFAEHDAQGVLVRATTSTQDQRLRFVLLYIGARWVIQEILPST